MSAVSLRSNESNETDAFVRSGTWRPIPPENVSRSSSAPAAILTVIAPENVLHASRAPGHLDVELRLHDVVVPLVPVAVLFASMVTVEPHD
jgi:hypothetical protein